TRPAAVTTVERQRHDPIDDKELDTFKATPVSRTHEAAAAGLDDYHIFHTESAGQARPADMKQRPSSQRKPQRIAIQFETERQIQKYLTDLKRYGLFLLVATLVCGRHTHHRLTQLSAQMSKPSRY